MNTPSSTSNSKRELTKLAKKLLFFLPLLLAFGGLEYRLGKVQTAFLYKMQLAEREKEKTELLGLGSCSGFYAFNPEKVSCLSSLNLANPSQSVLLDLKVLQHFRPRMPRLKAALIVLSPVSLDYKISTESERYRQALFYRWNRIKEEEHLIPGLNHLSLFLALGRDNVLNLMKSGFNGKFLNQISEKGWYQSEVTTRDELLSENRGKARAEQHNRYTRQPENREVILSGLRKTISDFPEIQFYLFPTLIHPNYDKFLDPERKTFQEAALANLEKQFSNVRVIAPASHLVKTENFEDFDHLNRWGANRVSEYVGHEICESLPRTQLTSTSQN